MTVRPAPFPARHGALAAALVGIAGLQLALIGSHDYFVDEWQSLQIAVQSPDWPALLEALRYEGHPPLWYALLRGLAAVVGPGHALAGASVVCAIATIGFVGFASRLPLWAKVAILLSEPILFEYGTVSRGYSLCVALVFATLACWDRRRWIWLPLALLPLVDFLGGLMAGGLIVMLLGEKGWCAPWWPGVAAFMACAAFAAWTVIPAPDFVSVYHPLPPFDNAVRWTREMAAVTLPVQWNGGPTWDVPWTTPFTPALGLVFLVLAYDQTRTRPVERVVAMGFPLALLAFMMAVHTLAIRHLMLAGVMLVAVLWRQAARGEQLRLPARIWLLSGAICGLATAGFALARPFDTAPAAARTILAKGLAQERWLSFPPQHAQGVAALAGIGFEGLGHGCTEAFIRWNYAHGIESPEILRDAIAAESARGGRFYLLSQYLPAAGGRSRLIAKVPPGLDGKVYYLFAVPGRLATPRAPAPPCVPGLRPLPPLLR